jgi:aryl-alcohol dehydrogenase-like predicted oxidoreductase
MKGSGAEANKKNQEEYMRYRKWNGTELVVSEVCFGTWPISGHGMGKVDEKDACSTISRAVEMGVNFFDTADMYGFGYAEELLGRYVTSNKEAIIATKVGLEWDAKGNLRNNLQGDYIIQACEASLKRLKVDAIHLYQLHWPDPDTPLEETMAALQKLVDAGKVRYVGVSNFSAEQLEEASRYMPIASNQIEYLLLDRRAEDDVIPYAAQKGISILPYKVLGRGILTGKFKGTVQFEKGDWRSEEDIFQQEQLQRSLEGVEQLKPIAARYGCTVSQLVIAWTLRWEHVPSVIIGAKRPDQIAESCLSSGIDLSPECVEEINSIFSQRAGAH